MKIEDLIGRRFYTLAQKNDVYKIEKINEFGKVFLSFNGGKPFEYHLPDFCLNAIKNGTWILIEEESEHPSLQQIEELYKNALSITCAETGVEYPVVDFSLIITETNEGFYNHNGYKITLYDKKNKVFASYTTREESKNPFKLDEYIHNNDAEKRVEAQDKLDVKPNWFTTIEDSGGVFSEMPVSNKKMQGIFERMQENVSKVDAKSLVTPTIKEIAFDFEIQSTMQKIQQLLLVKGKEYRRNKNPYHNFEVAARKKNITPERALDGFLLKHLVSYDDMLNDIEQGILPKIEVVEEKMNDIIVYFLIQKAQIINRINNGKS